MALLVDKMTCNDSQATGLVLKKIQNQHLLTFRLVTFVDYITKTRLDFTAIVDIVSPRQKL